MNNTIKEHPIALVALLIATLAAIGSAAYGFNQSRRFDELTASLTAPVERPVAPTVDAQTTFSDISENQEVTLLDARPNQEFVEEHVKGAINIPLRDLEARAVELYPFTRPIITMCSGDECELSTKAATQLLELGFTDVRNYKDGIAGWKLENLPLVRADNIETPGDQRIAAIAATQLTADQLEQLIREGEDLLILDIRGKEDYNASHIQGAISLTPENVEQYTAELEKSKLAIIVDETGNIAQSGAVELYQSGITNIKFLIGGMGLWDIEKREITTTQ